VSSTQGEGGSEKGPPGKEKLTRISSQTLNKIRKNQNSGGPQQQNTREAEKGLRSEKESGRGKVNSVGLLLAEGAATPAGGVTTFFWWAGNTFKDARRGGKARGTTPATGGENTGFVLGGGDEKEFHFRSPGNRG